MKIYTITLNPAYDVHVQCPEFQLIRENFASVICRDAGGKGINVSRALHVANVPYTAVVVTGNENCAEYKQQLKRFDLNAVYIETKGRIRENITVHHGNDETRISFSGAKADGGLLDAVAEKIGSAEDVFLVFTGSLPYGISKETAKRFLLDMKKRGAKILLDCRSFDLEDIQQIAPWLVKPNGQEASAWFQQEVSSVETAVICAGKLHEMGVENAVVSLGGAGAVLYDGRAYYALAPTIKAVSSIGAGDSSIAGFLTAFMNGRTAGECLATAVAFGSAACMEEGTQPPRMETVARLLSSITVREV